MQDLFIEFLPPWVETGLQPAFYDRESGTVLQQTARMYAKVNELVKAVNGMEKIIKEYVEYIDNYFKNLDVQEEINNKLDEMAEGGELASIIAQFLEMSPVFAYGTISEMASASNLQDGCIARVLGNSNASDGDGAYYTIRTRIESDDPDGVNLVAIGDSLVGVRVTDAIATLLDETIASLGTTDTKLANLEKVVTNNDGMFLGTFFDNDTTTLRIVASKDGFNFTRILPDYAPSLRDPQISYIDGKFVVCCTSGVGDGILYETADLVHWTYRTFDMGLSGYAEKWAPEIFVDTDDKIYFTVSAGSSVAKNLYIAECTDFENLTFSGLRQLHAGGTGTIAIDANICKKNGVYYLAWADQGTVADGTFTSTCKIASSTDLTNWSTINSDVFAEFPFVEGIQIIPMNDRFIIMGDATNSQHYYAYKQCFALNNTNGNNGVLQNPASLMTMRHGSIAYFNDKAILEIIADATEGENINLSNEKYGVWSSAQSLTGTITNFIVQPNMYYPIYDDCTITNLYNPYHLDRVQFVFRTAEGKTLTIGKVQNTEGNFITKNTTRTNSSDLNEKIIELSLIGDCYWFKD